MSYGTALVDTIQSSTTGTPTQFNDGSGTQIGTLCRAWANFNGTSGASPVIRASFNISSVTRNGTGDYTVNFTNAFADTSYSVMTNATGNLTNPYSEGYGSYPTTFNTSSVKVIYEAYNNMAVDGVITCISVFR